MGKHKHPRSYSATLARERLRHKLKQHELTQDDFKEQFEDFFGKKVRLELLLGAERLTLDMIDRMAVFFGEHVSDWLDPTEYQERYLCTTPARNIKHP